jgi:multiple sugar transport system substrate-binding protein
VIKGVDRRSCLLAGAGLAAGVLRGTVPSLLRTSGDASAKLVIVSGLEDGEGGARQALVDLWNQMHPDKRARIELVSGSADEQHDAMVRYAKGEEPIKADILNLDVTAIAEFAEFGHIAAWPAGLAPQKLLGELLEKPRDSCYYHGRLWALPFNTDAGVLFARRGLLRPQPPATPVSFTWNEIVAQRPPAGSATPKAAYAGQLDVYEGLTVNALEALWAEENERHAAGGDPLGGVDRSGDLVGGGDPAVRDGRRPGADHLPGRRALPAAADAGRWLRRGHQRHLRPGGDQGRPSVRRDDP